MGGKDVGEDTSRGLAISNMIGTLFCILLICASIASFVIKFTPLYFVAIYPVGEWKIQEWILFIGFINQVSGIALSGELEMLRVLLFKFGGESGFWGSEQIEACSTYFHYLAARTVEQLGAARGLVLMWTLTSKELQKLLVGHTRAGQQAATRAQAVEMFDVLHDKERLEYMRDSLIDDFNRTQGSLNDVLQLAPYERRMEVLNDAQKNAIGKLRLACRAQEFIWEWSKVELLEAPLDSSSTQTDGDGSASEDLEEQRVMDLQSKKHGTGGSTEEHDCLSAPAFIVPPPPCGDPSCVAEISDFSSGSQH